MTDKVSIILPTMRERVFETLDLYRQTTHWPMEIIVVTENSDLVERLDKYSMTHNDVLCNMKYYHSLERLGALKAWNYGLSKSTGKYIFPSGDDQIPHDNWFLKAMNYHKANMGGYGMVGFNDLNLNGNTQVATTVIYDRDFCKDVLGGVCAYECYNYLWVDVELQERAKRSGHFYWLEDAIVEHAHCSNGKREQDWIDDEKVVNNWQEIDRLIYEDRKSKGFPNDFEPVI